MAEWQVTRIAKAVMIATIHNEPGFSELFNSNERRLAGMLLLQILAGIIGTTHT
jgi:hypothetical protein